MDRQTKNRGQPNLPSTTHNNKALTMWTRLTQAIFLGSKNFSRQQGFLHSAGLTFYALLSFIPLIFLLVSLAGLIWGDTIQVQEFIQNKLAILPWAKEIVTLQLNKFLNMAPRLSWISFIFIFWSAGLFFHALQISFNYIDNRPIKKQYWRLPLPWLIGPFLGISFIILMLIMHVLSYIPARFIPPGMTPDIWTWLGFALLIFSLYQILPQKRFATVPSFILSLALSLVSQLITKFFTHILWTQPNYSLIYGTLSSIILFLLWLNANMILILWGAHFLLLWEKQD
ncbi:YihY/virulence factor BrkB family protein [Desulfohalobiaceae bacterium Ax17]|jgi:membrane protein|uniref:YihY/virulence factor BrkB family protein n=1 Tax=Desulfovulcanus ferrireducens TaxID=2831190 RepID=UPI00207BA033|nr:YihY/virulence factor BrkB family protein [Desulfovulcanus ferrireducens]MBT8762928.1 YihY/virulence factor BrkB family protein [Desulfovulcanus ferrireducens]